jgi:hypothetical protein
MRGENENGLPEFCRELFGVSMRKDDLTKCTDKVLEDRDAVTEETGRRSK